jgi:hypothetical protein
MRLEPAQGFTDSLALGRSHIAKGFFKFWQNSYKKMYFYWTKNLSIIEDGVSLVFGMRKTQPRKSGENPLEILSGNKVNL